MAPTPFTKNYADHSSDNGYQFEFHCDKCGNGYRSSFITNKLGMAASLLKAAGSIFGGTASTLGYGADQVKDAFRGEAWDSAFKEAVEEIRPKFHQCTRCGQWVCPEVCWNSERGLCEACAPSLQEEAGAAQAQVAKDQVWEKARQSDQTDGLDLKQKQTSSCGKCGAGLQPKAKFCTACGSPVGEKAKTFCPDCGAERGPGAKFCPGCGKPA